MITFSGKITFRVVFCVILISCGFALHAQGADSAKSSGSASGTGGAQGAPSLQGSPPVTDERAIVLDSPPAAQANGAAAQTSSIWILLRVVLVLLIVCGGIYGTVYLLKKSTKINAGNDPYLKSVSTLSLSTNKSIRVITVGSQAFLIGVTDQSISLISEIKDRELIDAMNLESDLNATVPAGSFASVLSAFLPKQLRGMTGGPNASGGAGSEGNKSPETSSTSSASGFLKKQRDRIQNNGSPE